MKRIDDLVRQYADLDALVSDPAFRTARAERLLGARIGSLEPLSPNSSAELRKGRAIFAKQPSQFKAWDYLSVFSAATFLEPDLLSLQRQGYPELLTSVGRLRSAPPRAFRVDPHFGVQVVVRRAEDSRGG